MVENQKIPKNPARFRFQWGYPERDGGGRTDEGQRKSLCLILDTYDIYMSLN